MGDFCVKVHIRSSLQDIYMEVLSVLTVFDLSFVL